MKPDYGRVFRITPRERQALDGVAAGLNNKAIAENMSIGKKGVEKLVSTSFAKLLPGDRDGVAIRVVVALKWKEEGQNAKP